VVVNDNDFGLAEGAVPGNGSALLKPVLPPTVLGVLSFSQDNGLDPSDRDDAIAIDTWPAYGMYMPDAIAPIATDSGTFFITANEGDSRDYDEARMRALDIDTDVIDPAVRDNAQLGRLKVSALDGDIDDDGDHEVLMGYGARSFSIWDAYGNLVYDSGDTLERLVERVFPNDFNADHAENDSFDSRSDDKGPEPEGVAVGVIGDRTFAFLGLERIGGVVTIDVTEPSAPVIVDYTNLRNFLSPVEYGVAGDLGPEGLAFVSGANSPTGEPLLVVGNEVSGTTSVFRINL